jgi:hypothetical protein
MLEASSNYVKLLVVSDEIASEISSEPFITLKQTNSLYHWLLTSGTYLRSSIIVYHQYLISYKVLPPYQFIRLTRSSRKMFDPKFRQQNINPPIVFNSVSSSF